jgi:transcriptional regulator with XRE-family HTH domain
MLITYICVMLKDTLAPTLLSTMPELDAHIGSRIRLRRAALGMSQEAVAAALGVSFQQIQKYERGINRISASRLYAFGGIFSVSITFFFEGYDVAAARPLSVGEDPVIFNDDDTLKMSQKETLELIRAYYQIKDVSVRKKMIELMRALSESKIDILTSTHDKSHDETSGS